VKLRALTDPEFAAREAIKARVLCRWRRGEYKDAAHCKRALRIATAPLGRPIPGSLVARAVREYGHLGLRALDVAADWTLAGAAASPRGTARRAPRARRRAVRARARSPGRRTDEDPDPDPDPLDLARFGGCRSVDRGRACAR
jgi:hypothetical protein